MALRFPSAVRTITSSRRSAVTLTSRAYLRCARTPGRPGPHANRIVVDLSQVTFCDASGLAVLIGARRRAWLLGGSLRLAAPAPPVAACSPPDRPGLAVRDLRHGAGRHERARPPGRPRFGPGVRRHAPGGQLSTPPASSWRDRRGGRPLQIVTTCMRLSPSCSRPRTRGATPIPTAGSPASFTRWPARTPALTAPVSSRAARSLLAGRSATRSPIPGGRRDRHRTAAAPGARPASARCQLTCRFPPGCPAESACGAARHGPPVTGPRRAEPTRRWRHPCHRAL